MSEFNEAIDRLRIEIQNDRFAQTKAINEGFDRMFDKFDEHAQTDVKQFAEFSRQLDENAASIQSLVTTKKNIGRGLWAVALTAVTGTVTWLFSFLK